MDRYRAPPRSQEELERIRMQLEMLDELRDDAEEMERAMRIVDPHAPAGGDVTAPEMQYYLAQHEWGVRWSDAELDIGPELFNTFYAPYQGDIGEGHAFEQLPLYVSEAVPKDDDESTTIRLEPEPKDPRDQGTLISTFRVSSPECENARRAFKLGQPTADFCAVASQGSHKVKQRFQRCGPKVIAVSYVWGSPPYREAHIGQDGDEGSFAVQLGTEWKSMEFLSLLCSLSKLGWLWLDQEAKRQSSMSVEGILASIPYVFETCRVVAIAWGISCPQQGRLIEQIDDAKTTPAKIMKALEMVVEHLNRCYPCSYRSPWGQRLWPRQEALYAQDLQMLQLSVHSALDYARETKTPWPKSELLDHRVPNTCDGRRLVANMATIFTEKWGCKAGDAESSVEKRSMLQAIATGLRLILGGRIICPGRRVDFDVTIQSLISEPRLVSQPCDLVLAVWCDLRSDDGQRAYVVPKGAKGLSLEDLLRDAWRQYTTITGRSPPGILFEALLRFPMWPLRNEMTDTRRAFGRHAMPYGVVGNSAVAAHRRSIRILPASKSMVVHSDFSSKGFRAMLEGILRRPTAIEDVTRLHRLKAEMAEWPPVQGVCNALVQLSQDLDIPGAVDSQMLRLQGGDPTDPSIHHLLDFTALWLTRLPGHMYNMIIDRAKQVSVGDLWTIGFAVGSGTLPLGYDVSEGVLYGMQGHDGGTSGIIRAVAVFPQALRESLARYPDTSQVTIDV